MWYRVRVTPPIGTIVITELQRVAIRASAGIDGTNINVGVKLLVTVSNGRAGDAPPDLWFHCLWTA